MMVGMTLTEFLLARIAEDETVARRAFESWVDRTANVGAVQDDYEWQDSMRDAWLDPARPETPPGFRTFAPVFNDGDLRVFAEFYSSHPDFDEAWRP